MGSHGKLHTAMEEELQRNHSDGQPMTMQDAIDAAAESLRSSGVGDNCSLICVKDQLTRFYGDITCAPRAVHRNGGPIAPPSPSDDF